MAKEDLDRFAHQKAGRDQAHQKAVEQDYNKVTATKANAEVAKVKAEADKIKQELQFAKEQEKQKNRRARKIKRQKIYKDIKTFASNYWKAIICFAMIITGGLSLYFIVSDPDTRKFTVQQKTHNNYYATMPGFANVDIIDNINIKDTNAVIDNYAESSTMTAVAHIVYNSSIEEPNKELNPGQTFLFFVFGFIVIGGVLPLIFSPRINRKKKELKEQKKANSESKNKKKNNVK